MKFKLFKKQFFITAIIVVTSLVILMMILSVVLNNYTTQTSYTTLNECCLQINDIIEEFNQSDEFLNVAVSLSEVTDSDIFITDSHGGILMCTCSEWQSNNKCMHSSYIVPKRIIDSSTSTPSSRISTLGIFKFPQYVSVMSLGEDGEYFVVASRPVSEARNLIKKVSSVYYLWALIPLSFMLVAIFIMTYRLTKPLKSMSEAAKAMSRGDFSKRVPVTSDDEIGELAASFNMMTNSLSRLESMRRSFVGNVSHELRTPMTTIGGFIDGILDGTIKQEDQKYYLNIVSQEVKRLSRLVNGMLSVARLESGEEKLRPDKFDFYELLCTIMIGQERRIEQRGLNIEGLDTMERLIVCADKDLIYQVVYNLVDNAIKFANEGGKISVSLLQDAESITFAITNTGKGIPAAELPYIFDRFYKVDKSRSDVKNSTGLGLHLAKTIVSAHKGKILVTSKEEQFTTFKVILPKEI